MCCDSWGHKQSDTTEQLHIYNAVLVSTKRNEIGLFVEKWMDLETVIQSEVKSEIKNKYSILTYMCGI